MNNKVKVDIVSDVVCPWCIIGYKHFEAAVKELNLQDRIEIEWQPFELNPDMPLEGENLRDHVARKYGASRVDSDNARRNISNAGAQYNFTFDYFEEMKMVNTLDAHILLDYAHQVGKQTELKMRLFSAFFTDHKDVSSRDVLIQEAEAVGINPEQSISALDNPEIKHKVKAMESQWLQAGVSGVPTVIFNRKSALTGAQPQSTFKEVLIDLFGLDV